MPAGTNTQELQLRGVVSQIPKCLKVLCTTLIVCEETAAALNRKWMDQAHWDPFQLSEYYRKTRSKTMQQWYE